MSILPGRLEAQVPGTPQTLRVEVGEVSQPREPLAPLLIDPDLKPMVPIPRPKLPVAPLRSVEAPTALPPSTPTPRTADVAFPVPKSLSANEPMVFFGRPAPRANYGIAGNTQAKYLRSMPPDTFTFDRSSLRDVLRFLAEEAGIPFIGIPENSPKAQRLVTFRMNASPFSAIESLARQNDIKLRYDDGVWFMGLADPNLERARVRENENELVAVLYQLKHDPVERVDFRNSSGMGSLGGGNISSNGSGGSSQRLPLQNSQQVFAVQAPRIVNEIRVMLGMDPLKYDEDGNPDLGDSEDTQRNREAMALPAFDGAQSFEGGAGGEARSSSPLGESGVGPPLFPVYIPPQATQVIYNSDTNVLWVVATRKQHKWVADYLQRVDQPQDLIAIEVKFFETRKNPKTEFGINWQGTLGDGITVNGAARVGSADGDIGRLTYNAQAGNSPNLLGGGGPFQYSGVSLDAPYSAVLSLEQVSATLQAFMSDKDSSLVQYPRVLTINNREVAITSAENTPVNGGTESVSSGSSTSTPIGTLEYIPVGTQINILPKSIGKNQIALTVAITISQIVDFVQIDLGTGSNPYPVTTQRVYNASLQVDSGYTLAVGGLEKVADRNSSGGVPLLKDIPGLGYFFKNKSRERDKSNLIIFITPFLISDPATTPGISENPRAVIPIRPGGPPAPPKFSSGGGLVGGIEAIPSALAWGDFQLRYYRQTNLEGRTDRASVAGLRAVIELARQLDDYLQGEMIAGGGYASALLTEHAAQAEDLLIELNRSLGVSLADRREEYLP